MKSSAIFINIDGSVSSQDANGSFDCHRDETGIYDISAPYGVDIIGAVVTAQSTVGVTGNVEYVNGSTMRIHLTDRAGLDVDSAFCAIVFWQ